MKIYAAGVVCWREQDGKLEVALVHREVYKDWGFPKGKLDPGEQLPQTAVREVLEESGFKVQTENETARRARMARREDIVRKQLLRDPFFCAPIQLA